jgi:hypothetical protein
MNKQDFIDDINHPEYYGGEHNKYEIIEIIENLGLDFHRGNILKYLFRAGKKSKEIEMKDLEKAKWYLERYIKLKK